MKLSFFVAFFHTKLYKYLLNLSDFRVIREAIFFSAQCIVSKKSDNVVKVFRIFTTTHALAPGMH